MRWRRVWWLLAGALLLALGVAVCNLWVLRAGKGRMFDRVEDVPTRPVGLVLGVSRRTSDGRYANPHFTHRIAAAAKLYHAGKVKHLLVSGDNHTAGYDEPSDMRDALVARGVPAHAITLDYAGLRTLDSVVRAKVVFGQSRLVIVSEPFHNARALFLCRHHGIDAVAFNAEPVSVRVSRWAHLREYLARVKAVLDVYIFRTRPRHLGLPVALPVLRQT
jgi:SanA protein